MTIRTLALAAAAILFATAAQAHSHKVKRLEIVHPWCIETQRHRKPGLRLHDDQEQRAAGQTVARHDLDRRQGGAAPAGDERPVSSVGVATGGATDLKRDGPHIQLSDVRKQLSPYDSFLMTLVFERAGKVEVEVMVEEASILAPAKK